MECSRQEILRHIRNLSFPRRAGSPGEGRAFDYLLNQFRKSPFDIEVQSFEFSPLPLSLLPRSVYLLIIVLLFSSFFLSQRLPLLSIILVLFIIFLLIASTRWNSLAEKLSGYRGGRRGKNIIARIPGENPGREIVFMAHYDSKSQTLPIPLRMAGVLLFLISSSIAMVMILFMASGSILLQENLILCIIGGAALFGLPILLNVSGNRSPGAIDNASGVALLLELARVIRKNHREGMPAVTFVATGAEEEGLIGSLHFMRRHSRRFDRKKTCFVNFDGAGAPGKILLIDRYGFPVMRTAKSLTKKFMKAADRVRIDLYGGYLPPGAGVDSLPVAYRGFEAVTLSSGKLSRAVLSIHSRRDRTSHISEDSLEKLAALSLAFVVGEEACPGG